MNASTLGMVRAAANACLRLAGDLYGCLRADETLAPQKLAMLGSARALCIRASVLLMAAERSDPQETRAGESVSETELPQGLALETFKPAPEKGRAGRATIQEAGHGGNIRMQIGS